MKIYLVCILMAILTIRVLAQNNAAQTITGKVYRAGTDSIIASASVYYGGTMYGTVTDNQGNFTLTAKPQQIPVIVSCIGYYSAAVNYEPGKPLIVYLKPKLTELQAVTIRADCMKRSDEIAIFTKEFIGISYYAQRCTIVNIADINFFYNCKTQTLTASCNKPIIIENKELGYTVSYSLDKFEKSPHDLIFTGNYLFKDNLPAAGPDIDRIKNNREDAYAGSRMEFIRMLWNHNTKQKYNIFLPTFSKLTDNDITVTDSLKQKYVSFEGKIVIIKSNNQYIQTELRANEKLSFIDKDGFYGAGLLWSGDMAYQRIGDLLPFEYQPEKDLKKPAEIAPVAAALPATKALEKPTNQLVFEKTYLHTDRDVYAPGDTLWFKAYLVNAQDNLLANSSGNLYVDLISPDAKIISSEMIRLDGGLGNGDFDLADTLAPGQYRLRAYTNWMRNFGDNFIFEKEITVLSSSGEVAVAVEKAGLKKAADKKVAVALKNNPSASATVTATKLTATLPIVRFYPEGGSLVEGISSLIAVKADDGFGGGLPASGVVLTAAGDTITRFNCDSLGMGIFALLPVKGQVYHAVVSFASGVPKQVRHDMNFELPPALSIGLALQVKQTDSLIRAVVSTNADLTALGAKPTYTLTVKHAGVTLLSQQLQLASQQTAVKISTANLPEGIAAITLYDETGKPNCERLVYIHQLKTTGKVSITMDKQTYQPNEKVTVSINAPANSSLSLAVVDAGIAPEHADDIVSYLRLQSEVKGNVEHARRYFDTTNVNRFKQLDMLLMTQGWRDFVWRRLADTAIRISYAAENGVNVSGKVEDEISHKPMPNLNVSLYADAAKGNKIFSANTDGTGKFNISNLMLYGKQNVKLASVNGKGEKRGSFLVDTIFPLPVKEKKILVKEIVDTIKTAKLLRYAALSKKETGKQLKEVIIKAKAPAFTSTFDKNYVNLDNGWHYLTWGDEQLFNVTSKDYWTKTLTWFVLQNFKNIVTNPNGSGVLVRCDNHLKAPVLVVNGSTFHNDPDLYWNMPIEKFKKVELVIAVIPPGVLNLRPYLFLTLKEDALTDNPGRLSLDVQGYYEARTFYKPVYIESAVPKIDYRTTINWEPNIKTDAAGKATVSFYNAVPAADIRVVVQGITNNGVPVTSTISYTIK